MSFALPGTPIGSPQQQQDAANFREQSATQSVVRQDTLLVKDTIEVPFTQVAKDIYKYRQPETKAMMPMYLQVFLNRGDRPTPTWPEVYKELEKTLPNNLKALLRKTAKDENGESIKRSLEFAAKGLDWLRGCKGVKVQIDDEERKKREEAQAQKVLDFYREVLSACTEVAKGLPPLRQEREFFLFLGAKIPQLVSAIGSKRERVSKKMDLTQGDQVIAKEIDELRSYLDKSLGERRPLVALFLVDYLELVHHLAYPKLNKRLFRLLWNHNKMAHVEVSLLSRMLGSVRNLASAIAKRGGFPPIEVETGVFIGELLLLFLYMMERCEKKKDFTFFLTLTMMIGSSFLKTTGKELMQALLIDEVSEEWIHNVILGLASAYIFYNMKVNKMHEKESDECFEILKGFFLTALTGTLSYLEKREGEEEVKAVCMKLLRSIEEGNQEEFIKEIERSLGRMEIKSADLSLARKGLEELEKLLFQNLSDSEKENHKLAFSARSA